MPRNRPREYHRSIRRVLKPLGTKFQPIWSNLDPFYDKFIFSMQKCAFEFPRGSPPPIKNLIRKKNAESLKQKSHGVADKEWCRKKIPASPKLPGAPGREAAGQCRAMLAKPEFFSDATFCQRRHGIFLSDSAFNFLLFIFLT